MSVSDAAQTGTRLELLQAIRARLADSLEDPDAKGYALANVSKVLLEIDREIRSEESQEDSEPSPDMDFDYSMI